MKRKYSFPSERRRASMVFMIALVAIFFLAAMPILGQPDMETNTVTADFSNLFTSLAGLAAGVLFFTSFIKKYLKTEGVLTIILSAAVSFILGGLGMFLQLGIFAAIEWYYVFIYGLAATAMANGLSTWGFISDLLVLLKLKLPKT